MAEYIEREALHSSGYDVYDKYAHKSKSARDALLTMEELIKTAPAADVVEVRHARFEWGFQNGQYGIWCTNCGAGWVDSENAEWIAQEHQYCPNCGAKMDGGNDNA